MHGRLKVKSTAEQDEAKRKERHKKLTLYTGATQKALQKRENKEYDEEALSITGQLLAANPDVYSLWNFRKEIFTHLHGVKSASDMSSLYDEELAFVEQALRANPKSYSAWEQRCWVMRHRGDPDWTHELNLCNKYLEYDERNFHCWDYRRVVVKSSNVPPEKELEYTDTKISTNFSNYSSWHYRSKLLPVVHPDPQSAVGVEEEVLLKEFELAQNAFFTDPNDQSAWFYHRWLLGRAEKPLGVECFHVARNKITVLLSKPAKIGAEFSLTISLDGASKSVTWSNPLKQLYCDTWTCPLEPHLTSTEDHLLSLTFNGKSASQNFSQSLTLLQLEDDAWWETPWKPGMRFMSELSATKSSLLTTELDSCMQLDELEPDNKWILLTIVWLMRALQPLKYQQEVLRYLDQLANIDPMRKNYYKDMRSKYSIEHAIESSSSSRVFSLSNHILTTCYHANALITMETINLSHNALQRFSNGYQMACVKVVNLSHNDLETCAGMEGMAALEMLDIEHNNICTASALSALSSCPRLSLVHIKGNPICQHEDIMEEVNTAAKHCGYSVLY